MSVEAVREAVAGSDALPSDLMDQIGRATTRLGEIADEMAKAKDTDTARFDSLKAEQVAQADTLQTLKTAHDDAARTADLDQAIAAAKAWSEALPGLRSPSKAHLIGGGVSDAGGYQPGDFLLNVGLASSRDAEEQAVGKAALRAHFSHAEAWGKATLNGGPGGKATLGLTDATGGWVIPNAIVDDFIKPASAANIYRALCTSVNGVTAATVDIPFRIAAPARAAVVAWGTTKENVNLVYNGYTATMYTIARIHDLSNGFVRHSRGAAEQDVMQELASAFALGESYYVREGSGSSEPFGYTSALTNGPAAFRSTFSPSATTLAGSMATAIATAAGALAGRSVPTNSLAAVLSATSYWTMLSQGTDTAGFFFNPAGGPEAINGTAPGTLISPFGIPVYPDPGADQIGTAAVTDNLVVGNWKKFKVYFGENYRVDVSSVAGSRWDDNLTGFRGEEEMGFDARPSVYAGWFQMITDIVP